MQAFQHREIVTNGIHMHIAEQGHGPLVVLCHGFPELWYSWRHQIPALAARGFHVVAPDQRGYGQTDQPPAIEDYTLLQLVGDMVGLVHALGEHQAIIIGHDWGAAVAYTSALLRPDLFRAVGLLSVPYAPTRWDTPRPTDAMRHVPEGTIFYQDYFQEPGVAEAEFEANVGRTLRTWLYGLSGDASPAMRVPSVFARTGGMLNATPDPAMLPPWLTADDMDYLVAAFTRTGFRGGLNWYRNLDVNWAHTRFLADAHLQQPTLFIGGDADGVYTTWPALFDGMDAALPNLRAKVLLPGVGHWTQQEAPEAVNTVLAEFLGSL